MNFLVVLKILAGLTIGAIGLLALFFIAFIVWLSCSKAKKHFQKKGFFFMLSKQTKTKYSTRQRMEQLRAQYQQKPLTKQERLALRKAKHLHHRQNFLNRLAKRKR